MDVSRDTVGVEWDAPKDDGGSKIIGYIIQKKEVGRRTFHHVIQVSLSDICEWRESNLL